MEIVEKVHPEGIRIQDGLPPDKPKDFYESFQLPGHFDKPLHKLYPETVDRNMYFLEEPHLYVVKHESGVEIPTSVSVTGLAHAFDNPFDADSIIGFMRVSKTKHWPRLEYVLNSIRVEGPSEFTSEKGCMLCKNGVAIATLQPNVTLDASGETLYTMIKECSSYTEKEDEYYVFDREMTTEEIKRDWNKNGMYKRNRGTYIHNLCERALEGLPYHSDEPEMEHFYNFIRTYMVPVGATVYCTEREILYKDADLAGSVDAVFKLPDGTFVIVDWKVSDKLSTNMFGYGSKKFKAPFNHLDDCDGAKYAIQLSLYQAVFESQYNMRVSERILVSLSATNPFVTAVPYMEAEANFLLERQIALTRARADVENYKCELSGQTLINAVRTSDNQLVSEKVAIMKGIQNYEADLDVRKQVDEEVGKLLKPIEFDTRTQKTWKKRFPAVGMMIPFQY